MLQSMGSQRIRHDLVTKEQQPEEEVIKVTNSTFREENRTVGKKNLAVLIAQVVLPLQIHILILSFFHAWEWE